MANGYLFFCDLAPSAYHASQVMVGMATLGNYCAMSEAV